MPAGGVKPQASYSFWLGMSAAHVSTAEIIVVYSPILRMFDSNIHEHYRVPHTRLSLDLEPNT